MTNFLQEVLDNQTKRVRVWQVLRGRWVVDCGICGTDIFSIISAPWAHDWRTAYEWGLTHSQHHEQTRCKTCGYASPLDEYVNYVQRAQEDRDVAGR